MGVTLKAVEPRVISVVEILRRSDYNKGIFATLYKGRNPTMEIAEQLEERLKNALQTNDNKLLKVKLLMEDNRLLKIVVDTADQGLDISVSYSEDFPVSLTAAVRGMYVKYLEQSIRDCATVSFARDQDDIAIRMVALHKPDSHILNLHEHIETSISEIRMKGLEKGYFDFTVQILDVLSGKGKGITVVFDREILQKFNGKG